MPVFCFISDHTAKNMSNRCFARGRRMRRWRRPAVRTSSWSTSGARLLCSEYEHEVGRTCVVLKRRQSAEGSTTSRTGHIPGIAAAPGSTSNEAPHKIAVSIFDIRTTRMINDTNLILDLTAPPHVITVEGRGARDIYHAFTSLVRRFHIELRVGVLQSNPDQEWVCPICLEASRSCRRGCVRTKCCHQMMHTSCAVDVWVSTFGVCPMCRCNKCPFCMGDREC
jgi:hypothetical protein